MRTWSSPFMRPRLRSTVEVLAFAIGGLRVGARTPKDSAQYSGADVPELAALYAIGVIRNHPFVDGNKRVGAVLLDVFLELHGVELTATDGELVEAILGVAFGMLSDDAFTTWVREHCFEK